MESRPTGYKLQATSCNSQCTLSAVARCLLDGVALQRQLDQPVDERGIGQAGGLPHLGKHADGGESGDGVDLVELAICFTQLASTGCGRAQNHPHYGRIAGCTCQVFFFAFRDRITYAQIVASKRLSPDLRSYFSKLGKKGGKKGGPARAAGMTPEQRSESARNAVVARWAKAKKSKVPESFLVPAHPQLSDRVR